MELSNNEVKTIFERTDLTLHDIMKQGAILLKLGDIGGAEMVFQRGVELHPEKASPYNNLGVLSWTKGNTEEAIEYFHKALERDPEDASTRKNLEALEGRLNFRRPSSAMVNNVVSSPAGEGKATLQPRQSLRILHNMARSGGTIISKCLGCMDNIILLSEIHPFGTQWFNPLNQAQDWFQLFSNAELPELQQLGSVNFIDLIGLIEEKTRSLNKILVIRDWSHIDFTAVPFVEKPTYQLTTADIFRNRFEVRNFSTVRHPVDQWLSLRGLAVMHGKIGLGEFLEGYYRFAEKCRATGFIRYEDFVRHPEEVMKRICDELSVPFDPGFIDRWPEYSTITGETQSVRGDRRIIKSVPRKEMEPGLLEQFEQNPHYHRSLELLGYGHPE